MVEEDHSIYNNKGEVTKSYLKGDIIKKQSKVEAANVLEQVAITIDPKKKFEDYDINYDFYMRLIRKEIQTVEPTNVQQNLF